MTDNYSSTVLSHWNQLKNDVWAPLQRQTDAPDDMFIELLRYFWNKTGEEFDEEALSDITKAKEEFKSISSKKIESERACINILEGFYDVLSEFGTKIADNYKEKLRIFCSKYNLRYTIADDCKFKLTIKGLLMDQICHLQKVLSVDPVYNEILLELEKTLARLKESNEPNNCIRVACNLIERLAVDRANCGTTLGAAVSNCGDLFPHEAVRNSLKDLYRFASDYPNIRHAGNPTSKIRDLAYADAILFITLSIGYTTFLCDDINDESLLTGDD